jgi:osmotically-inducible protein OsmY
MAAGRLRVAEQSMEGTMAWDRGERGYRSEYFSRGRGPTRDDQDDREYYRGGDYDDDDVRYGRPQDRRHWRGSEYEAARDTFDRGRDRERDYRDYDDAADRFIDRRHRHGFLRRGESAERQDEQSWQSSGWRARESIGDQDRWTGPYSGRAPKNYRRSDERIHEDICERLMEHPSIDPSDVEVSVNNGDVTLSGTVENRAVKHLTEVMTETVSGVKKSITSYESRARAPAPRHRCRTRRIIVSDGDGRSLLAGNLAEY